MNRPAGQLAASQIHRAEFLLKMILFLTSNVLTGERSANALELRASRVLRNVLSDTSDREMKFSAGAKFLAICRAEFFVGVVLTAAAAAEAAEGNTVYCTDNIDDENQCFLTQKRGEHRRVVKTKSTPVRLDRIRRRVASRRAAWLESSDRSMYELASPR